MHDGAVVFDTRLNNKQLEKDYAKAVKKLEDMEGKAMYTKGKRGHLEKEANALAARIEMAARELAKMEKGTPEEFLKIPEQKEKLDGLQKKWEAIQKEIERYDKIIEKSTEEIEAQKNKCARLTGKIEEAAAAQNKFDDATDSAVTRIEKLTSRIGKLATRALVFSVITQGFRLMRDWLGEVVTKNDQTAAAIARLKGALLTLAQPLLTVIIPVFTAVVNLLTAVIGRIATFLSMLGGKSAQESAKAAEALHNQGKAYEEVGEAAKEASKQLMGFDELNKLEDTSVSAGGSGGGDSGDGDLLPA